MESVSRGFSPRESGYQPRPIQKISCQRCPNGRSSTNDFPMPARHRVRFTRALFHRHPSFHNELIGPSDHSAPDTSARDRNELLQQARSEPRDRLRTVRPRYRPSLALRHQSEVRSLYWVGVAYTGKFGETADFIRAEGGTVNDVRFIFGIRLWY